MAEGEQICQKQQRVLSPTTGQRHKLMLPYPRFCSALAAFQALVTASHYFQASAKTWDQLPPYVNLLLTAPVRIPSPHIFSPNYPFLGISAKTSSSAHILSGAVCHALLNWPLKPRTIFYCNPQSSRWFWTAGRGERPPADSKINVKSSRSFFSFPSQLSGGGGKYLMELEICYGEMLCSVVDKNKCSDARL